MARRHDADAGGDPELLAAKARVRETVWDRMSVKGIARFPSPRNRIPNFVGAEHAARRLAETDEWRATRTVKSNPDSPQLPVRVYALEDGKLLYMAVPRLAETDPFFVLDPAALSDPPRRAATITGAGRSARRVALEDMEPVDLVVTGCVAVTEAGERLGKGGGFSDLELALAVAAGLVDRHTLVVTTVHDVQVQPAGSVPTTSHDVHVDLVVTPTRVVRCPRPRGHRLPQLRWSELTDEKVEAIPLLSRMRDERARGSRSRSSRRRRG
ncbi:MAG: 5-formyltetrahydrofolate cyclo-ligase [Acidimicrobiia bacterium]|nr:MAG: 5-formyltetrahydrofolate cyclo-ligase [Acidimicrobiia bacterium]